MKNSTNSEGSGAITLRRLRSEVDEQLAEWKHAKRTLKEENAALVTAEEKELDAKEAQRILQLVARSVQQQVHDRIAGVVTRCLQSIFEDPYEFRIKFEEKRGKTEARLIFLRDGNEMEDPMECAGGGAVEVAAFALRLACLVLSRPTLRRVMILDEPFRFVSREHRGRLVSLLHQLAKDMKIQFVIITHIEELKTGTVIEL